VKPYTGTFGHKPLSSTCDNSTWRVGTPLGHSNAIPRPECGEMHTLTSWSPTLFHRGEIGDRGIVISLPGCGRCRKTQHGWGIGVDGGGVGLVLQYQPQQFQLVGVAGFEVKTGRMMSSC